jgi:hypothetical protein
MSKCSRVKSKIYIVELLIIINVNTFNITRLFLVGVSFPTCFQTQTLSQSKLRRLGLGDEMFYMKCVCMKYLLLLLPQIFVFILFMNLFIERDTKQS